MKKGGVNQEHFESHGVRGKLIKSGKNVAIMRRKKKKKVLHCRLNYLAEELREEKGDVARKRGAELRGGKHLWTGGKNVEGSGSRKKSQSLQMERRTSREGEKLMSFEKKKDTASRRKGQHGKKRKADGQ